MTDGWCSCEECRIEAARLIPVDVLRVVEANLAAFEAVARVLTFGANKHPGGSLGPDGKQTAADHIAAAERHRLAARRSHAEYVATDHETGESHLAHEAARLILAIGMERR